MDLSEYKSPPLSPWQRGQAFEIEGSSGATIRGHFADGAPGASYMMVGSSPGGVTVRVFVRAFADPKQVAGMLRAMASKLEGVTLERV